MCRDSARGIFQWALCARHGTRNNNTTNLPCRAHLPLQTPRFWRYHRPQAQLTNASQSMHIIKMQPMCYARCNARTCSVGRVLPYVHVEIIERDVDVGAAASAAHEIGASGDGVCGVRGQEIATMLHNDVALSAVAHEGGRSRVAGILAVCCNYCRIYNDSRVTNTKAAVIFAGRLLCLFLALGPAHLRLKRVREAYGFVAGALRFTLSMNVASSTRQK